MGYEENEADVHAVCKLAEDARDAVMEYQVSPNPPTTQHQPLSQRPVRSTDSDIRAEL